MSDFDSSSRFKGENRQVDTIDDSLAPDKDFIMEQILENLNTTPIGNVLKKIASLPDGRKEKVLDLRQQLSEGKFEFNEYLDVALDKILEDLTA